MKLLSATTFIALVALAGCADPRTAPTQMAPAAPGSSSASPQSPNSLPRGDVVNAPRAPATGAVSSTRTQ